MARKSRLSDAVWTAFTETIRYIIIPIVLIDLVTSNWPQLSTAFMGNLEEYTTGFGALVVAASTLEAMNRPGTFRRLLFGLTTLAFIGLWLYVIFGGGLVAFDYGPYHVSFDMSHIVTIMLVGISLKGLLVMQTYTTYKSVLAEEERTKRIEESEEKRMVAEAKKERVVRRTPPVFDRLSSSEFHITADDDIGFVPPPLHEARQEPTDRADRHKTCSVCGERSPANAQVCTSCGAWFSKESFRFGKSS